MALPLTREQKITILNSAVIIGYWSAYIQTTEKDGLTIIESEIENLDTTVTVEVDPRKYEEEVVNYAR
tara:strand:+ start:131 stop:334 length:204 start_codon:yes stop_codon:yes gene_type:complete